MALNIPEDHKNQLFMYTLRRVLNKTPEEVFRISDVSPVTANELALKGSILINNNIEYKRIVRSFERLVMHNQASERLQHLTQVRNRAIKQL